MRSGVADDVVQLIGDTPLVKLNRVTKGIKAKVYAKLEFFNPGGSVKDRIGIAMIREAEADGVIRPGYTIVEPTSGNTGMGLALAAILRGYKIVFTVPDKMSRDKIDLLRALGAKVRVTPSNVPFDHPASHVKVAERLAKEIPHAFMPNQYENMANPKAHYATTGPEIWQQTGGSVDVLVAGVGTGGTITGTGRFLKEKKPGLKVVAADPEGSLIAARFYGREAAPRRYKTEGIGEDFIPSTLDMSVIDEVVTVSDKEAFLTARRLAREEGILAGGSSGAAVYAALKVARGLDESKTVVVILPDTGRSYLNKLYNDDWMKEHGYLRARESRVPVDAVLRSKPVKLRGVVGVGPRDSLMTAIGLMTRHDISQLPVLVNGVQVGSISGASVVGKAASKRALGSVRVEEIMDEPLPTVEKGGTMLNLGSLLKDKNAVAVIDGPKVVGIITTIDVINYLAKR
ncbi:MAG: cystathionine beta-synthase [Nitrososphaerales archaeon]|nr:cystathionine beta-synthase [Nitrososphaerales archaeon]